MPLRTAIETALRSLLRPHCTLCGSGVADAGFCPPCARQLAGADANRCPVCGIAHAGVQRCGRCLRHPPPFAATVVACDYGFPLDAVVGRLKYGRDITLARPLGELLADTVAAAQAAGSPRVDLAVPVPLTPRRLRERGFNQALEIARPLARRLEIALDASALRRERDSPPQATLGLGQRAGNVAGAFACTRLVAERVAVIDDVMTSGATLREIAACLRGAGAREVHCWVLARTPEPAAAAARPLSAVP